MKIVEIHDANRIVAYKSKGGGMRTASYGGCMDSRKFRIYTFVDAGMDKEYEKIGTIPQLRFYYNIASGEMWSDDPDLYMDNITVKEIVALLKGLGSMKITRVRMLPTSDKMPDAVEYMKAVEALMPDIDLLMKSTKGNSANRMALSFLKSYVNCVKTILNRLDSDNENQTGNYGYEKRCTGLYKRSSIKRMRGQNQGS